MRALGNSLPDERGGHFGERHEVGLVSLHAGGRDQPPRPKRIIQVLEFVLPQTRLRLAPPPARILTSPPGSEAVTKAGIDVGQIALAAPRNLPSFDDTCQRHTGMLDTL